jgi:ubiquinone/menaquinone biosynthesis C-methylase UbiE
MRRLAGGRELLDGTLDDVDALDGNLRDLERINRRFGGSRMSLEALRALLGPSPRDVRLLDVGSGGADIPLALLRANGPWRRLEITAVDSRQEVLDAALRVEPAIATTAGLKLGIADGLALTDADGSFDVAHASLVLHHLEPREAVRLLRELRRVSTVGVVINDLDRSRRALLGAWVVLHLLTRNPYTLHDGVLSVRRAYTRAEVRELLRDAGLRPVREIGGFAGHRWAIAAVPA